MSLLEVFERESEQERGGMLPNKQKITIYLWSESCSELGMLEVVLCECNTMQVSNIWI